MSIRIQEITKQKHDPCVWGVFAAIIHETKTGFKDPWWQWTAVRKDRPRLAYGLKANFHSFVFLVLPEGVALTLRQ